MSEEQLAAEKLMLMIKITSISEASALIRQFPSIINSTDRNGNTPLILAAYYGNDMLVKFLIENGADVTIKNNKGYNALYMARHEHEKASTDPSDSIAAKKLGRYNSILSMLYAKSNEDQLKDLARRDADLSSTTVYIFPSIHPDATEADELRKWIRRQKEAGIKLIAMFEFGAEAKDTFSDLGNPKKLESLSKRIAKPFREAVTGMFEMFRDEQLQVYPVDTRISEHRKDISKLLGNGVNSRVEHIIREDGDLDRILRASVEEYAATNTWLHNRNVKMISNIKELAGQNAPCAILMVCGAGHAAEIEEGVKSRGLKAEIIRDDNSLALQVGRMDHAACLAAQTIKNGVFDDSLKGSLLRQVCFVLELRPKGGEDDEGKKFSMDEFKAALDKAKALKTVSDMKTFIEFKVAQIRKDEDYEGPQGAVTNARKIKAGA